MEVQAALIPVGSDLKPYVTYAGPRRLLRGLRMVLEFPNGYGASVIRGEGTYGNEEGLWELAVSVFRNGAWDLCYDTPITSDVLGHLTEAAVIEALHRIMALPEVRR